MKNRRYPKLNIRSKNELAKHISGYRLSSDKALALVNDVQKNFDEYWEDHKTFSQPEKEKWVRDSSRTKLGKLLKQIDLKVLKPHDSMLPNFIFGGLTGLNHKSAVMHLLGKKRKRVLLKLDITKFFEQIEHDRVLHFFMNKANCSHKGSKIIADLCCVNYGSKDKPQDKKVLARGFATSPRLAVWCNLDIFLKIDRLVKKELKGKDPRIAIYVDDIGITASGVSKEDMMRLYPLVKNILEESDVNQKLPLNPKKTKIIYHSGDTYDVEGNYLGKWSFEILGLQMNRNSVTLGTKTRWKLANVTEKFKSTKRKNKTIRKSRKALLRYKDYVSRK